MTRPGLAARVAAYRCVEAVDEQDAYANLAMPGILAEASLAGRDAGFATELAYAAIRMRGLYDAIIAQAARREPDRLEAPVLRVLRLGVHQALNMRVPPHAAVSETVALMREVGRPGAAGLANAVMRRVSEASLDEWLERVAPGDSDEDIATRHSHPVWVVRRLREALAADSRSGQIEELLASHNVAASVTLVARPGLISREDLLAEAGEADPTTLSPLGVILGGGDPGRVPAVGYGTAAVQDEGSQIVALAAVRPDVDTGTEHEAWHDMCAGPGGKAAILACLAGERGAHLDATDRHPHRSRLVEEALRAVDPSVVTVRTGDARVVADTYDRILLDAPCTGLGALRRRPEARWRRSEEDLDDLIRLQAELLTAALRSLKPGGVLAYVTCSPVVEETREAVRRALAGPSGHGVERLDTRTYVAATTGTQPEEWGVGPDVQMWTHAHGTDSMFLALLKSPYRPPSAQ